MTPRLLSWAALLVAAGWMAASLDRGMTADELFSLHLAEMGEFYRWIFHQNHPPLYWTVLKYWVDVSRDERWMRLLSVPFGLAAVWAVGKVAAHWEPRARVPATWAAALFPPLQRWGSEIRMYAWLMGWGMVGLYLALRAHREKRSLLPAGLCLTLACLSHELGAVWALTVAVILWREGWRPRAEAVAAGATVILGVAVVHVLPFLHKWWWMPDAAQVWEQGKFFVGYYLFPPPVAPWAVALGGAAILWGGWCCRPLLVGSLFYAAVMGVVSWLGPNVLMARAFVPLYGLGFAMAGTAVVRLPRGAGVAGAVLCAMVTYEGWKKINEPVEPIKPVMLELRRHWQPDDILIVQSHWMWRIGVGLYYGWVPHRQRWRGPLNESERIETEQKLTAHFRRHPHARLHLLFSFRDTPYAVKWGRAFFPHRIAHLHAEGLSWWLVTPPVPAGSVRLGER